MGLITGLLTLPLAPVRGTVALGRVIQEQAEKEAYDDSAVRTALAELGSARAAGELSEAEIAEAEDALLEELIAIRRFGK
jgi:hypothetical protein